MKKSKGLKPDPELKKAIDSFPKILKRKEKTMREKQKIRENFLSVKHLVYK